MTKLLAANNLDASLCRFAFAT